MVKDGQQRSHTVQMKGMDGRTTHTHAMVRMVAKKTCHRKQSRFASRMASAESDWIWGASRLSREGASVVPPYASPVDAAADETSSGKG
jgi:hypothetical protein